MSFDAGRVTFCRLRVVGDAPTTADETALAILQEFAFVEAELGAPDEVEAGFITGEHLYDTQFTYEKNGFEGRLRFALRLDTHKVPSDVKQAHRRLHEASLLAQRDNPTGFLSRREKREAAELADRALHDKLVAGQFRRSKSIDVLWDLTTQTIFFASSSPAAIEQLTSKMHEAFNVELERLSAGGMALALLQQQGLTREHEDLRPTPFTPAPAHAADADQADGVPRDPAIPFIPWAAGSVDHKDFLGNELLIWLWHHTEVDGGAVHVPSPRGHGSDELALVIDKALDMECAWGITGKQTLRGDGPSRLIEAGEALACGKWPRKMGLLLADVADEMQWELNLQGDQAIISAMKLPDGEETNTAREQLDQRLRLICRAGQMLDGLMASFLRERASDRWPTVSGKIRAWIRQRRKGAAAATSAPAIS